MSININGENFTTFNDLINDEKLISKSEKSQIEFEASIICKLPKYNEETILAMAEAKLISKDPNVKGYTNMADLKRALEE